MVIRVSDKKKNYSKVTKLLVKPLDLTEDDFCEKVQNKHVQFQHEWLYIFGKEISLMKKRVK